MKDGGPNPVRNASLLDSTSLAFGLILLVGIATRIVAWWNPVAHVDDQFYLLAGQEMLKGHWPYIDVWDRKPLGLFLLYAGIAALGSGTILGLNLVATAFAVSTAFVIRQIGLRFTSGTGATLGAVAYLFMIPLLGGQNGQSPVFYNLLTALAAWLLFDATAKAPREIAGRALAAMLLCGLAISIKQVAFVEGGFFGLAFLWLLRRRQTSLPHLVAIGSAMILIALLPTALALAAYALKGREAADAFLYANFVSIFQRQSWSVLARLSGFAFLLLYGLPLMFLAAAGVRTAWAEDRGSVQIRLLAGWLAAAFLGYFAVPAFFDHYALPLIVPLSIAAAPFFGRSSGRLFFAGLVAFCLIQGSILDWRGNSEEARIYSEIERSVARARGDGCLYIVDGPSRLYASSGDCRLTRFLFPDHLNLITESKAVGVDTTDEVAMILAAEPQVIVTKVHRLRRNVRANHLLVERTLKEHYRLVYAVPLDAPAAVNGIRVWERTDPPPHTPPS